MTHKPTQDMRPINRKTREMPVELLKALIEETRSEDDQRIAEWNADDHRKTV